MRQIKNHKKSSRHAAFTLIELMVVVVVISILIGGVFKLLRVVADANKKGKTQATLEKLENALSGFYAQYGTYPPVAHYGSPDPFGTGREDDFGDSLESTLDERSAAWAAKCQPVAFEFPNSQAIDDVINALNEDSGAIGVNAALGQTAATLTQDSWEDVKMFKFGLLSYLLPRVEIIGCPREEEDAWSDDYPDVNFYKSRQWRNSNPTSKIGSGNNTAALTKALLAQRALENNACAHWLPNLENLIIGGGTVLNVKLSDEGISCRYSGLLGLNLLTDYTLTTGKPYYARGDSGSKITLFCLTVVDAYPQKGKQIGQEIYYYSPPPYQSYRIWSAGSNGKTFPPWIPLEGLTSSQRKTVAAWIADDIVGGSTETKR